MPRILVHVTTGPEHPTRAALGFLVVRAALEEGHDVDLAAADLAGTPVELAPPSTLVQLAVAADRVITY